MTFSDSLFAFAVSTARAQFQAPALSGPVPDRQGVGVKDSAVVSVAPSDGDTGRSPSSPSSSHSLSSLIDGVAPCRMNGAALTVTLRAVVRTGEAS